jgi:hypothetical protein
MGVRKTNKGNLRGGRSKAKLWREEDENKWEGEEMG